MKVLSLFDGISCGLVALLRSKFKDSIECYYASEIDPYAETVSSNNFSNIIRLGDVTKWKDWKIDWGEIDLLIGGSPCQGFSFAGKLLNFNDERSKLFFVYVDILKHIRKFNPNIKFLLENVKMKKEYQDVISDYLCVEPVRINSNLVAAARRDRLYWANFEITIPEPKNITFDDICLYGDDWLSEEYLNKVRKWKAQQDPFKNVTYIGKKQQLPCLTARGYNQSHSGMILISDYNGNKYRYLSNGEAELAMTLPYGYTKGISDRERARCIGNAWTVDIITHIFNCLPDDFC